jgi:hypothetical protein
VAAGIGFLARYNLPRSTNLRRRPIRERIWTRLKAIIYPDRLADLVVFKYAAAILRWLRSAIYPKYPTNLTAVEQTAVDQALKAQRRRRLLRLPLDFAFKGVVFAFLAMMIGFHYKAGIVETLGLQDPYSSYQVSLQMPWGDGFQATLDCDLGPKKEASADAQRPLVACKRITLHIDGSQEMAAILPGAKLAPWTPPVPVAPASPGGVENVAAMLQPPPPFKGVPLEEALALASKAGYQVKNQVR